MKNNFLEILGVLLIIIGFIGIISIILFFIFKVSQILFWIILFIIIMCIGNILTDF